ncbi:glycosyltransferase family 4 protein, partial [bacterium]|nr:glycosyltransferase family 4 protein [bacterium]
MSKIAIHFARFGPYHLARIESARSALGPLGWEVVGLETGGSDETYAWRKETGSQNWQRVTVFPGEATESIPGQRMNQGMAAALSDLQPDAIAIAGWGSPDARACLDWCRKNGAKAIVMSETREADGKRVWWKEWIKSRLIRPFDAALVGGASQRNYLIKLGLPGDRIQVGYNVVDNAYFAASAAKWQKLTAEMEDAEAASSSKIQNSKFKIQNAPYFLSSNRFIERKNLSRLIEAYAQYLHPKFKIQNPKSSTWNLCLLGDGELKEELIGHCRELGLEVKECAPWEDSDSSKTQNPKSKIVYFPGFRQIEELPRFYAHAGCFIHPALEEPWGLVLNEAMACGLPILSGSNV